MTTATEQILSTLVTAADAAAQLVGDRDAGDAIKVTGIVLKGAQGVIHELTGDDVDRARATQALYQAAGASADLNSRLPGLRKEIERILYQPSPTGSENDTVAAIMRAVGQHLGPKQ